MITIVNYGLGNIQAFVNIYKRLNIPVRVAQTADELSLADKIILPGVGAFDWAMNQLQESGMRECLDDLVTIQQRPVLGVCVGMQIMARSSEEGELPGLGWIDADVKIMEKDGRTLNTKELSLPHMGWNEVQPIDTTTLFKGIENPRYYFLHSFYIAPDKPEDILATTDYYGSFASSVRAKNVFGVQFHPEKSHQWGIQLLKNFAGI